MRREASHFAGAGGAAARAERRETLDTRVEPGRPPAPLAGEARLGWARWLLQRRETGIVGVAVAMVVVFQILTTTFLTATNLSVIFQLAAEIAIIAVAEVPLMVLAEIDLSLGNIFALSSFVMYFAYQAHLGLVAGIAAGVASGAVVGLLNGLITVKLRVPSFIGTLGMLYALNGFTLIISGGYPVITPAGGGLASVMGAANAAPFIWAGVIVVVWHVFLNRTRVGGYTVAVGSNPVASREAGIQVDQVKILAFVLAGALAALTGIIEAFHLSSIDPLAGGTGLLLEGIAAAVIGGTALTGGSGTIVGAAVGAFVISGLNDGLNVLGVNAYAFDLILGVAIVVAMVLNTRIARSGGASRGDV
ncbi:MAG: ABC transporter permease [Firmicutes bacterium]|nr:ABC transporter permease [Bacillota bacterium]